MYINILHIIQKYILYKIILYINLYRHICILYSFMYRDEKEKHCFRCRINYHNPITKVILKCHFNSPSSVCKIMIPPDLLTSQAQMKKCPEEKCKCEVHMVRPGDVRVCEEVHTHSTAGTPLCKHSHDLKQTQCNRISDSYF